MISDYAAQVRAEAWPHAPVSEAMSRPVLTIDAAESLWDAWQLLSISGLRHLAVLEDGQCLGVIADRNILSDIPVSQERMRQRRVGELLSRGKLRWVGEDALLADVARTMAHYSIEAVPVLDERRRLVGIVTGSDLVRWWANDGS
ncbi:MAG: HPP family protein [Candidatus Nanopelagicales bacterium]